MKIFRHLFLGLVLVLTTFSSLTFVQAATVAQIETSIKAKEADIKKAEALVAQLEKDLVAASGALEGMKRDMDDACDLTRKEENNVEEIGGLGAWQTADCTDMSEELVFEELITESEKTDYFDKCDACQKAYKKYTYSPANQVKANLNNAKNQLEYKEAELKALEKKLENAKESTETLENNKDYQKILELNGKAKTMAASTCGSKISAVTDGAGKMNSIATSSSLIESARMGVNIKSDRAEVESLFRGVESAYNEAECSEAGTAENEENEEEAIVTTEDDKKVVGANEGDTTGKNAINDINNTEDKTAQKVPPATQSDADHAFSAYQREIERADEWMTATEGRRNYVPTKQLREEINPILEKGGAAMMAEDWGDAMTAYNEVTAKVLSANTRFLGRKYLELSDRNFDSVLVDNKVVHMGGNFEGQNEERVGKTFFTKILPMINRLIGVLGILYLLILGVKFILAQGDEEKMGQYKDQAVWLIVGLGLVSVAEFVGFDIFDPSQRDILSDAAAKPFYAKLMQLVRFFEYVAMGLVLVNGIISGYKLITSGEEEETVSQEKKFLKSFIIGTIFILMAEVIVRVLAYQDENLQTTQDILIQEVAGIINFLLTFIGGVAMLMLIVSSIYYVTSFGEEDQMSRAKRMILTSLGGVAIAFSAYTIAQFLINH